MGCHFLLQGIFPTQGSNPGLPHCRQTLYPLNHQGSLVEGNQGGDGELNHCLTQGRPEGGAASRRGAIHSGGSDTGRPGFLRCLGNNTGGQGLPHRSLHSRAWDCFSQQSFPALSKALLSILLSFYLHIKILGEKSQDIRKIHSPPNATHIFSPHLKLSLASVGL